MSDSLLSIRIYITLLIYFILLSPLLYLPIYLGLPIWIAPLLFILLLWYEYYTGVKSAINDANAINLDEIDEDTTWLVNMNKELSSDIGIPEPKLYIANLGGPNAFAAGRKRAGHIVIDPNIIQLLTRKEIKALMIHEMSHLKSYDIIPMVIAEGVAKTLSNIIYYIFEILPINNNLSHSIASALVHIIYKIILIGSMLISREREYMADSDAIKLGFGVGIHDTLFKLQKLMNENQVSNPPNSVAALCFTSYFENKWMKLFDTHPSLEDRIKHVKNKLNS